MSFMHLLPPKPQRSFSFLLDLTRLVAEPLHKSWSKLCDVIALHYEQWMISDFISFNWYFLNKTALLFRPKEIQDNFVDLLVEFCKKINPSSFFKNDICLLLISKAFMKQREMFCSCQIFRLNTVPHSQPSRTLLSIPQMPYLPTHT